MTDVRPRVITANEYSSYKHNKKHCRRLQQNFLEQSSPSPAAAWSSLPSPTPPQHCLQPWTHGSPWRTEHHHGLREHFICLTARCNNISVPKLYTSGKVIGTEQSVL